MDAYRERVASPTPQSVLVDGSFAPAGVGAPTDVRGQGFIVTRTGVGTYLLTLKDRYAQLVAATGGVQLAVPAARTVVFNGEVVNLTTVNSIALTVLDGAGAGAGTAIETAANANNRIHFRLSLCNTIKPGV